MSEPTKGQTIRKVAEQFRGECSVPVIFKIQKIRHDLEVRAVRRRGVAVAILHPAHVTAEALERAFEYAEQELGAIISARGNNDKARG